jgi:hypothetical protein
MPEISKDASILIGISYQALDRAKKGNQLTEISDCTVALLFASFFIEANLNQIIDKLGKEQEMINFLKKEHPGLQDKMAWFYNSFIAQPKLTSRKGIKELYEKLKTEFPGFEELYNFRNNISHGIIDRSIANLEDTERLRVLAKEIVDKLINIAEQATGQTIQRNTTYYEAIS